MDFPNNWVVLEIRINPNETIYKILAGWSGGYLDGDSWKVNSGIVSVYKDEDYYIFVGESGSEYKCHKDRYFLKMNNAGIYAKLKEKFGDAISIMPEDTDWLNFKWKESK